MNLRGSPDRGPDRSRRSGPRGSSEARELGRRRAPQERADGAARDGRDGEQVPVEPGPLGLDLLERRRGPVGRTEPATVRGRDDERDGGRGAITPTAGRSRRQPVVQVALQRRARVWAAVGERPHRVVLVEADAREQRRPEQEQGHDHPAAHPRVACDPEGDQRPDRREADPGQSQHDRRGKDRQRRRVERGSADRSPAMLGEEAPGARHCRHREPSPAPASPRRACQASASSQAPV